MKKEDNPNKDKIKEVKKKEVITDDEIYTHDEAKTILHLMRRGRLRKREEN